MHKMDVYVCDSVCSYVSKAADQAAMENLLSFAM